MRKAIISALLAAWTFSSAACVVGPSVKAVKTVTVQPADKAAAAVPARAQCLLRVSYYGGLLPMEHRTIDNVCKSSAVAGQAARDVFGKSVSHGVKFASLGVRPPRSLGTERILIGRLSVEVVRPGATPPQAEEFLAAVCKRLHEALGDAHNKEMDRLRREAEALQRNLDLAKIKMAALQKARDELSSRAGQTDLSRSSILKKIGQLDSQRQQLEMKLAGQTTRLQAYQDQIAVIGARAQAAMKGDAVAAELAKIVEGREKMAKRIREVAAKGAATEAEVPAAEVALAEAKAKLAERREAVSRSAGGELLEQLNRDHVTLSIDATETRGSLKVLSEQLARLKDPEVLKAADQYEREIRYPLAWAQGAHRELTGTRDSLLSQIQMARPPAVTEIGAGRAHEPTTDRAGP